ncbi:MAG TPA: hypothetical protein VGF98_08235 [Candidatus Tumulicola sp.]|jgi:hypothetical protein
MTERPPNDPESQVEEGIDQLRDGVVDADATDMISGEQLITQAETLLPLLTGRQLEEPEQK